ncbi:hypothetical protein BCY91_08300 [Pelobium manganitolerans]|uniref:Uncharacterized protein n=1 Tax=Pelobium manganitolerans TaxID=1842495 RepID=A0A419S4C7_9SPHI|nr:hypothetical protein [Pelobium manganitolerans]RKD14462.1 hypothetical protein BCY91_08300 [Pelobium manganitolerans]
MKKLNFATALLVAVIGFTACKKERTRPVSSVKNAKDFTEKLGSPKQTFSVKTSELPKTLSLANGTRITIQPNSFTMDGHAVTGDVTIEAYEMLTRSAIILSGTNTNHISGSPLISQGFIFVDAKVDGKSVDRMLQKPLTIKIPAKGQPFTQIWEGVENVADNNQFAWAAPGDAAGQNQQRDVKAVEDDFVFDFGKLGWVNCDIFYNSSAPKTTVRVTVLNNPGTMATFRGFSGETFVFFCATGDNVVAQIYTPDGANKVKSYDNSMPIGSVGKLIAFSIKDGKYYFAKKDITITADMNESLSLTESTEATVQAEITALDL